MANFSGSIQLCSGHHPAQRGTSCPDLCPACHSSLRLPAAALAAVPFARPCPFGKFLVPLPGRKPSLSAGPHLVHPALCSPQHTAYLLLTLVSPTRVIILKGRAHTYLIFLILSIMTVMKVGAKKCVMHLTDPSHHESESPGIEVACGGTGRTPGTRGSALGRRKDGCGMWSFFRLTPFVPLCEILLQLFYSQLCYRRSYILHPGTRSYMLQKECI